MINLQFCLVNTRCRSHHNASMRVRVKEQLHPLVIGGPRISAFHRFMPTVPCTRISAYVITSSIKSFHYSSPTLELHTWVEQSYYKAIEQSYYKAIFKLLTNFEHPLPAKRPKAQSWTAPKITPSPFPPKNVNN